MALPSAALAAEPVGAGVLQAAVTAGGGVALAAAPKEADFLRRAPRSPMAADDRAELRRLAEANGRDFVAIAASPFGARLALTAKQLRDSCRVYSSKPRQQPDADTRRAMKRSRVTWNASLQAELSHAVATYGRRWVAIQADAGGGVFRSFSVEFLKGRHARSGGARTYTMRKTDETRGVCWLGNGRFQVSYRGKYLGLFSNLHDAARRWNAAAIADGVPADKLNAVPPAAEAEAEEAVAAAAAKN